MDDKFVDLLCEHMSAYTKQVLFDRIYSRPKPRVLAIVHSDKKGNITGITWSGGAN